MFQAPTPPTSEYSISAADQPYAVDVKNVTIQPQAGAIVFSGNERLSSGALAGFDFVESKYTNIGISAGILYSGLNNAISGASGFWSGTSTNNKTYIFQVPIDLTLGIYPSYFGRWRLTPHFGGNFVYSSSGVGIALGSHPQPVAPGAGQGATWNAWLGMGVEASYSLSRLIDIGVRYDATLLDSFTLNTFTVGLGFKV